MENIFLMEFKEHHKSPIKTQLRNNMCHCFVIYCYNNVPITIVSLFWAKLYLHCEGSWSGPSGSWLGREPYVPKCTSERQHTGCVMGLKTVMSKHFAYLHICCINREKNWTFHSLKNILKLYHIIIYEFFLILCSQARSFTF